MVLLTGAAVLVGAVLTYFTIGAVATVAHWVAVGAALLIGAGLVYHLLDGDLQQYFDALGFSGGVFEVLSAGIVGAVAGFVSYRLIESVFAALGFAGAFIVAILAVASFVFGPGLVASVIGQFIGALMDSSGGK